MWLYGQEPIMLSYHPAKFGGHMHSDSGDVFSFYSVTWFWRDFVTSTCFISLIWVYSCRCTYLPKLVVISLIEMEIAIVISILTWKTWKKLNSTPRSTIIARSSKSGIPIYNSEVPNTAGRKMRRTQANCKEFYVSRKRNKIYNDKYEALFGAS